MVQHRRLKPLLDATARKNGKPEGAGDGIRTHDNNVGNVVLYQLSYARVFARIPACRTFLAAIQQVRAFERPLSRGQIIGRGPIVARDVKKLHQALRKILLEKQKFC